MSMPISPVRMPAGIPPLQPDGGTKAPADAFQSVLSDAIGRVEQFQQNSQVQH